jgi:hypothetical protein
VKASSIESAIRAPISSFHLGRIRRIDTEDFAPVKKKVVQMLAERGIVVDDDYLERGIFALKQYYAVALLDPNNSHAVSDVVDPFWHAHMLFSQRYAAFCADVVGVYMHHFPLDHDDHSQLQNVAVLYPFTVEVMSRLFDLVDPEFWPTNVADQRLICMHKGNQGVYDDRVYQHALLPPDARGVNHAFV